MSGVGSIRTADLHGILLTEESFREHCVKLGLRGSNFGAEFSTHEGERFKIIGLRPTDKKYTVVTMRIQDGKQCMFSHFHVVALLHAERQTKELK